ncbi:MAG: hypothetical protein EOP34_01720 [Rickettsiales bacterium]|nr:MAG: hypothetical protein EOP34_01720 [Rickettsiales bacterium]
MPAPSVTRKARAYSVKSNIILNHDLDFMDTRALHANSKNTERIVPRIIKTLFNRKRIICLFLKSTFIRIISALFLFLLALIVANFSYSLIGTTYGLICIIYNYYSVLILIFFLYFVKNIKQLSTSKVWFVLFNIMILSLF